MDNPCGHSSHEYNPYAERHECCDSRYCRCTCDGAKEREARYALFALSRRDGVRCHAYIVTDGQHSGIFPCSTDPAGCANRTHGVFLPDVSHIGPCEKCGCAFTDRFSPCTTHSFEIRRPKNGEVKP